jgi:hypothetical protein
MRYRIYCGDGIETLFAVVGSIRIAWSWWDCITNAVMSVMSDH